MDEATKRKIDVILREFGTLREEILLRAKQQFTAITLFGAGVAWIISRGMNLQSYIALITLTVVFGLWYWILLVLLWRCGSRIKEIEEKVNSMAGDKLLEWETRYGPLTFGSYRIRPKRLEPS